MKQNLYQIFSVPQNASQSVLDAAYTELLTKHKERHDLGGQDTKNELVTIKWAYDHLSNADKRAAYDVKLEAMPTRPRIVHPKPKVSPLPTTASQQAKVKMQTDKLPLQSGQVNQPPKEKHWSERENDSVDMKSTVIETEQHQVDVPTAAPANIESNATENEIWTQTILFFVHEPMVVFKVGRYPVSKIINQFPIAERRKVKEGIDAVTELGFFVMDENDICLTDKGETLFEVLSQVIQLSVAERLELAKTHPRIASLLTSIGRDSRLMPPSLPANVTSDSKATATRPTQWTIGNIFSVAFLGYAFIYTFYLLFIK
ncbi:MAG: hypothetical protein HYU79_01245 [Nitrosomonadales bacterium]|nr:hypothetical protein [Nitrosomonadales bacterium]